MITSKSHSIDVHLLEELSTLDSSEGAHKLLCNSQCIHTYFQKFHAKKRIRVLIEIFNLISHLHQFDFFLSNNIRIEPICHVNISHKMTHWIIRWLILRQMSLFFFFFFSISRLSFTWLQIIRLTDCSNWFVNYVFFPSLSLVISTERNGNREKKKYEELKSQHIFYTYKVRLRKSNEEEKCFTWKWHSRWYKIGFNTVLKAAQVVSFWLKC